MRRDFFWQKHTIKRVEEMLRKKIEVIAMDNYYIAHKDIPYEERKQVNYDEPYSINYTQILHDIQALKTGRSISQPCFSFKTLLNEESNNISYPSEVLIVEEIFSLYFEEISELMDLKIFVDADADLRLTRRILRDFKVHNRPLDFIIEQYLRYGKPMHELYVEPQKNKADIIISGAAPVETSLKTLLKILGVTQNEV